MSSDTSPTKGAAVVTGAAQGIGRAIALRLAEDGYPVVINDLPNKQATLEDVLNEIVSAGGEAIISVGDVTEEQSVKDIISSTVAKFGKLDVMVSNAGIGNLGSISNTTVDEWDKTFAINVRSTFLCYREAAAQMIKQGTGGRIVGASSSLGKQGHAGACAYVASKFAIRGLTQSAACEYGQYGITVNAYAPGHLDTPMVRAADEINSKLMGLEPGGWMKSLGDKLPVGFLGQPEEVAALVSYIVSPAARYMTGQSVSLNGGVFFD